MNFFKSRKWKTKYKKAKKSFILFFFKVLIFCFLALVIRIFLLNFFDPSQTAFMKADALAAKPLEFVEIQNLPTHFLKAILISEDTQFFSHSGFEWKSIQRAWESNLKNEKHIVGGSTISQQLTKNLFLSRQKSYVRKVSEAILTVFVELLVSKERILELYVNVAEMGPGVYGVRQASAYHFGKPASELTQIESALLASTLINGKVYGKKPYVKRTLERQRKILYRMQRDALTLPVLGQDKSKNKKFASDESISDLIKGLNDQNSELELEKSNEDSNEMTESKLHEASDSDNTLQALPTETSVPDDVFLDE